MRSVSRRRSDNAPQAEVRQPWDLTCRAAPCRCRTPGLHAITRPVRAPISKERGNADTHGSEGMHADAGCGLNRHWPTSGASAPSVCISSDPCASAFPLPVCGSKPATRDRGDFHRSAAPVSKAGAVRDCCRSMHEDSRRGTRSSRSDTARAWRETRQSAASRASRFLACCLRENQYASLIQHETSDVAHLPGMRHFGRVCLIAANCPRCVGLDCFTAASKD